MSVYKIIKKLCDENGISVNELAKQTKISSSRIFRWKTSSPSIDAMLNISEFFGVSIDYLAGRSQYKESADYILNKDELYKFIKKQEAKYGKDNLKRSIKCAEIILNNEFNNELDSLA